MQQLAASFSDERERLEKQWDSGDDVSTEDLRVALTRYRSFFDRLRPPRNRRNRIDGSPVVYGGTLQLTLEAQIASLVARYRTDHLRRSPAASHSATFSGWCLIVALVVAEIALLSGRRAI